MREDGVLDEFLLVKWAQVRAALLETIERFSDAELAYRPFEGAYSVGETILHIAHEEDIEVRYGLAKQGADLPPPYEPASYQDKTSILGPMAEVHEFTSDYLARLQDGHLLGEVGAGVGGSSRRIDMPWHVLEHEVHHRGELSLILGLLGRQGLDA
jgi:uncharacterized damage-inducible protein DinB